MNKTRTTKAEKRGKPNKLPKPRIPVAPPGYRHPSKKDYHRNKKVEISKEEPLDWWDEEFSGCTCEYCIMAYGGEHGSLEDLKFLLNRLGITESETSRLASYA